jgi:hypothetical protein
MFVLLMVYYFQASISCAAVPRYWILGLFLIPGVLVSFVIRRQILSAAVKKWSLWIFAFESFLTIWLAYAYFSGPMHDIALDYLGHHGRFGAVDLNGPSPFLLNDVTLPLILFAPPLAIGIWYLWSRTFQRRLR